MKNSIVFIVGPTGSGKTHVGIELAKRMNGEIISCDSMQVYEGLPIATNQPTVQESQGIPHHLIGEVSLKTVFDAGVFHVMALQKIQEIQKKGAVPIIVGGSGMYMSVLLDGLFSGAEVDAEIRTQLEDRAARGELEALYEELKQCDPDAAQRIHPNDAKRIVRALEVFRSTGEPISQWQRQRSGLWDQETVYIFGLNWERESLYERINARTEEMFERGLINEIDALEDQVLSRTAQAIIGIKEVKKYLAEHWSLDRTKDEMKKNTRRLAKRQMTWFRAEKRLTWIDVDKADSPQNVCEKIMSKLECGECDNEH